MSDAERIFVVGLNHLRAPIACRERASVPAAALNAALEELRRAAGLPEAAILSTCGRVEVVAVAPSPRSLQEVLDWFARRIGPENLPELYIRPCADAVIHVFRVAAGLDSWILGESEILGQVRQAYSAAQAGGHTGRLLNRLMQSALAAGKSVRARTGIQQGIHSIGGAAALLAKGIFRDAPGETVVFGAGQAAEAVARHLAAKNFRKIAVANRTLERARQVAEPLGAEALGLPEGLARLASAEVAVFSLSAPSPWLTPARLAPLLRGRARGLFVLDLGSPRNVDPACGAIDGVYLYNVDDLRDVVRRSMEGKAATRDLAEVLAAEEAAKCWRELVKPACPPRLCGPRAAIAQGRRP